MSGAGGWAAALLAALVLGAWLAALVELARAEVGALAEVDPVLPAPPPTATVAIAARDEEREVGAALRSVLALDHPGLEVIAVDDRSSDRTGAILDELARTDPRLRVLHVAELPPGWLGKNHALHLAGQAARGEWLLFTDADVHLAPDALTRGIAHAERTGLDHLAVGPRIRGGSPAMRLLLVCFALFFALTTRPWRAADPTRSEHIGIGAYNLVRRRALAAVGFHSRIALRPDDDVKLGKLLKQAGCRQGFLKGDGLVEVEWYRTAPEMVRGLEKNAFAFLDYSVARTLAAVAAIALLALWPLAAAWGADGAVRALSLASVAITLLLCWGSATRGAALSGGYALGYPLAALLLMATILNSMLRALLQGGVRWRGTLYPLAALRANRV